jgi:hypothetical protein
MAAAVLDDVLDSLTVAGFDVIFAPEYRAAVDRCKPWLSMTYGSTVPDDFEQIRLIKFQPVFIRPETTVRLKKRQSAVQLKMVGEGSYATVFSFVDPDYGIKFAVKRAKKGIAERVYRFRTGHRGCDLRVGRMSRLGQDRGSCLFASSI